MPLVRFWIVLVLASAFMGLPVAASAAEGAEMPVKSADSDTRPASLLKAVKNWLLLLNNDLDAATVSRIAGSGHDMAVIDFLPSQNWAETYPMAATVAALKKKPAGGRRLVIAYLNVGQAEDYRSYWKKGWKPGKPDWILSLDPDGWAGNFPVAYWQPEWQAIIAGGSGLLSSIVAAGFDGIYMDWVAGFEDEAVQKAARRAGRDPAAEMAKWIEQVGRVARAQNPDFLLIGQNAAPLLANPVYRDAIDAAVHETIWFSWTGPEKGDCPVPASAGDVGARHFLESLSAACRRAYEKDSQSAMHFIGESEIVPKLLDAKNSGKVIFTVDYAIYKKNVEEVVRKSRSLGFRPFVGEKDLNIYQEPLP